MKNGWTIAILVIALVAIFFIFGLVIREGFQNVTKEEALQRIAEMQSQNTAVNLTAECDKRLNCSDCLMPARVVEEVTTQAECKRRGGDYNMDTALCKSKAVAKCGWCPNAEGTGKGKCVPRIESASASQYMSYPLIPRVAGDPNDSVAGSPIYKCPLTEFVSDLEKCEDFKCGLLKECGDCVAQPGCGYCASSKTCFDRGEGVATCNTTGDFKTGVGSCPRKECSDITDCAECASTPDCGFCPTNKKCLKIRTVNPEEKLEKCFNEDKTEVIIPKTSAAQCVGPGELPAKFTKEKVSLDQLIGIQSNELESGPLVIDGVIQPASSNKFLQVTADDTGGAVTPPRGKGSVGAPGVDRPLGSSSSRPTYPAAAGLYGAEGEGPFETYVGMLVKSVLAAQGVPTTEPFRGGMNAVVANATQYFKKEGAELAKEE